MKKYLSLLLILLLSIAFNVKADMGPPSIAKFELLVSNKNGATCYEEKENNFVATNEKIPYNQTVYLEYKYSNDYYQIFIEGKNTDNCLVKLSDLSLKDSSFKTSDKDVNKIDAVYAIVLAGGGLNLRKGPSTMYSKVTLIPEKTILKLTHKAGTYWYYTEYNGNLGWVTAEQGYLGIDSNYILINKSNTTIYSDKKMTKKVGEIPRLTEITNYVFFEKSADNFIPSYYVNYNGIKGYIESIDIKVSGKINIKSDTKLYDLDDKVIKTIKPGTYTYSISGDYNEYLYLDQEKGIVKPNLMENESYEYVGNTNFLKKDKGYIGEGLFGEKVTKLEQLPTNVDNNTSEENPNNLIDVNDGNTNEVKEELKKQDKINNETIIIIVLSCIILALTVTVIILLVNKNKKKTIVIQEENKDYIDNNKEEVKEENEIKFEQPIKKTKNNENEE